MFKSLLQAPPTLRNKVNKLSFDTVSLWVTESAVARLLTCSLATRVIQKQESCAIAKMTAQCAPYMSALKIFGTPWLSIPPPKKILYAYQQTSYLIYPCALAFHTYYSSISTRSFVRNFRLQFWVGVENPNLGEGEAVGGQGWYRSKERWWVPMAVQLNLILCL